ncbi:hypothetical protein GTP27_14030 [Pseudoduganella sp. CY13W]|uniref:Uncharacterized protein n=2 Tax=Duganella qianjiadongensis TaxID=2692176 RepID=A0ABW9VLG2_9BURK|nr:hypothetical protein [Duganella qianjiadongensis]
MAQAYGWRALGVLALLVFGCRLGVAQVGPRYVLALDSAPLRSAPPPAGQVQLAGKGLALISFQGLRILALGADAEAYSAEAMAQWPQADLLVLTPAASGRYEGFAPLSARGGLPVIVVADERAPAVAAAPLPALYPMQLWDALHLNKGPVRLRVTALPGGAGSSELAGFMLDMGNGRASYRLYVSCLPLAQSDAQALGQRLPGADLVLLPHGQTPQLLALRGLTAAGETVPVALTAAGHHFKPVRR